MENRKKIQIYGLIFLTIYLFPLLIIPIVFNGHGIYDWDTSLQRYSAIYISLMNYGQIPYINAWIGGGTHLMQIYPFYGIFGLSTIIFGPSYGIYYGIYLYYILGYIGGIKLASLLTKKNSLQIFFSLYFVLSNSLAWHLSVGHIIFTAILLLPYILYYIYKNQELDSAVKGGFLVGLAFLDSFAYANQYLFLIASIALFIKLVQARFDGKIIKFCFIFYVAFLSVTLYRILSIIPIFSDFPRIVTNGTMYGFIDFIKYSLIPLFQFNHLGPGYCSGIWENSNYLGIASIFLILYSIYLGRYYNIIPFILLLFFYSNSGYFTDFNYYLKLIPTFSSHWCTARIRLLSPLIFGLALMLTFRDIKLNISFMKINISRYTLMIICILDIFIFSIRPFFYSHKYDDIKKIEWNLNYSNYSNLPQAIYSTHMATLSNIGILNSGDSNLPSERIASGVDSLGYISEYSQNLKSIEPLYWSPNKIIFKTNDLKNCVQTRIPAGNMWTVNGNYLFQNEKSINFMKLICAYPDSNGVIVLEFKDINSFRNLIINILFILFLIIFLIVNRLYFYKNKRTC